ncbi:cytochrome P450 2J6-like [Crotalus adamanteus]|uniref:Cytochrome P450 2J6-like n=1 Tax=Crotalus adamanteus TaxID=8729 RepID=A0AAW1BIP1_CROAD
MNLNDGTGNILFVHQLKEQNDTSETSMTPYNSIANDNGGDIWKQQREIGQLILLKGEKEKKTVESQVEEDGPRLVETFAHVNGQPFDPLNAITASLCKIVWTVSFGNRSPLEDKDCQQVTDALESAVKSGGSFAYVLHKQFSWLMNYFPGPHKNALSSKELVLSFIKKAIQKHKEAQAVKEPQDFTDFYLINCNHSAVGTAADGISSRCSR